VAVPVVVGLELVEVEQGQAERPRPAGWPPGEAVGAGQAVDLPVEGADLGERPQQGTERNGDRDAGGEHDRGADGALGQEALPGRGA
jgi:hypothetical protein